METFLSKPLFSHALRLPRRPPPHLSLAFSLTPRPFRLRYRPAPLPPALCSTGHYDSASSEKSTANGLGADKVSFLGDEGVAPADFLGEFIRRRRSDDTRVYKLMEEAEANPLDAAKQGALLAELNKTCPDYVVWHFEEHSCVVDSKGVAEYIRALVATNALAKYLPDKKSEKPSNRQPQLQELKEKASENLEKVIVSTGASEKRPLHVMMVDPKESNSATRFAKELLSSVLSSVAILLIWFVVAGTFQKFLGSSGGIRVPGVGSTPPSFSIKDQDNDVMPEKNVKTFKDVKGCDDAKQELEEIVEYLKNPQKFTRLGGKLPKAIAGIAGVPFFYRAGSEFEEMFVGLGARRVQNLFQAAKKKAPSIIFIDEIDAIGSTRKQWEGYTKKTLHQLLVEMDGFEQNEGIILIAATNLPEILDPALTRPGRFDRHIVVANPDIGGRQEISELYLKDEPLSNDVDVISIARGTPGFNGADLANMVNVAAIKAAVEAADKLTTAHLEYAKDRIMMGTERKAMFRRI